MHSKNRKGTLATYYSQPKEIQSILFFLSFLYSYSIEKTSRHKENASIVCVCSSDSMIPRGKTTTRMKGIHLKEFLLIA